MDAFGARLFVYPCYSHGDYSSEDYVTFLIAGASMRAGNHYVPSLNKRVKGGLWGGISASYWTRWQIVFNREVKNTQKRLNIRITEYVQKFSNRKGNDILFTADLVNQRVKRREFDVYNKAVNSRFDVNFKFSNINDGSAYARDFVKAIDTNKKGEFYVLGPGLTFSDHMNGTPYRSGRTRLSR
jgi:hypothetical protein